MSSLSTMSDCYDLVIVGAGPAGLSAGLYGTRMGLKTALVGEVLGGMAGEAWIIENYPGLHSIKGMELVERMHSQAQSVGLEMLIPQRVGRLESRDKRFMAVTDSQSLECHAVVLATGCRHKLLDVPGEGDYSGKGVSYCAVCDGVFFKGRDVAVIGGGNTAAMEALYLREIARKVYVVHRRDDLRADAKLKQEVLRSGVEVLWRKTVKEIAGGNVVEKLVLTDAETGNESSLDVDGVFIAIGESPQSQLARSVGVKTSDGFIEVNRKQETNVPGIYAAGDVTGGVHQIGVAVGEGISAAVNAYLYVMGGWYGEAREKATDVESP